MNPLNSFKSIVIVYLLLAFIPLNGQILLTEISYNPPESNTDSLEYIELYNSSMTEIDLTGYSFSQGIVYTFENVVIGPQQYIVLAVNAAALNNILNINALQWSEGALNNGGESLTLIDPQSNVVFSVAFDDESPWPTSDDGTDGGGKSIELCDLSADMTQGASWKVSENALNISVNGVELYGTPSNPNSITECALAADHNILVGDFMFTPKDITINEGESVGWTNSGGFHNVNGTIATFPNNPASFGNGDPSSDFWNYVFTFSEPGIYTYQCDPHATQGMIGSITVLPVTPPNPFPLYAIPVISTVNNDGILDSINLQCSLRGIVYGVNMRPQGLQFVIIDGNNNGFAIFNSSNNLGYTVQEGDDITVSGIISQFNGLGQLVASEITLHSTGNVLVTPTTINQFSEEDESSLIELKNVRISSSDTTSSGINMVVTDGLNDFTIRIDNDVNAYTNPIPQGDVYNIRGILGQFDTSSPYTDGYQLLPRYVDDFLLVSNTIDKELDKKDFLLFPNPTTGLLKIGEGLTYDRVDLINALGKKCLSVKTQSDIMQIDHLESGMYILQLIKNDKIVGQKRVVKY